MIQGPVVPNDKSLTYLALGDSYTIGEAVAQSDSFPYQLLAQLKTKGINIIAAPKIIAQTGWTTAELQTAIAAENIKQNYDLVTLLIGVNNQYRGYSLTEYREDFIALLQRAIAFAGGNEKHVFVISIPDWGATTFGKESGRDTTIISQEIDAFNVINKQETIAMGVSYTDITPASRNAKTRAPLIASDGLHPSGKMYKEWAVKVAAAIEVVSK